MEPRPGLMLVAGRSLVMRSVDDVNGAAADAGYDDDDEKEDGDRNG